MLIKGITAEDFVNYKKPSMYIAFPYCTFKCEKECGIKGICQNSTLAKTANIEISIEKLLSYYFDNPITKAIVLAGLEPFDSFNDVLNLINKLRQQCDDDVIIYTGYTEEEIKDKIEILKQYKNIIIKYGRFKPNYKKHYDSILGVNLISDNQYAKKIS